MSTNMQPDDGGRLRRVGWAVTVTIALAIVLIGVARMRSRSTAPSPFSAPIARGSNAVLQPSGKPARVLQIGVVLKAIIEMSEEQPDLRLTPDQARKLREIVLNQYRLANDWLTPLSKTVNEVLTPQQLDYLKTHASTAHAVPKNLQRWLAMLGQKAGVPVPPVHGTFINFNGASGSPELEGVSPSPTIEEKRAWTRERRDAKLAYNLHLLTGDLALTKDQAAKLIASYSEMIRKKSGHPYVANELLAVLNDNQRLAVLRLARHYQEIRGLPGTTVTEAWFALAMQRLLVGKLTQSEIFDLPPLILKSHAFDTLSGVAALNSDPKTHLTSKQTEYFSRIFKRRDPFQFGLNGFAYLFRVLNETLTDEQKKIDSDYTVPQAIGSANPKGTVLLTSKKSGETISDWPPIINLLSSRAAEPWANVKVVVVTDTADPKVQYRLLVLKLLGDVLTAESTKNALTADQARKILPALKTMLADYSVRMRATARIWKSLKPPQRRAVLDYLKEPKIDERINWQQLVQKISSST